jgi:hypothetical protein
LPGSFFSRVFQKPSTVSLKSHEIRRCPVRFSATRPGSVDPPVSRLHETLLWFLLMPGIPGLTDRVPFFLLHQGFQLHALSAVSRQGLSRRFPGTRERDLGQIPLVPVSPHRCYREHAILIPAPVYARGYRRTVNWLYRTANVPYRIRGKICALTSGCFRICFKFWSTGIA